MVAFFLTMSIFLVLFLLLWLCAVVQTGVERRHLRRVMRERGVEAVPESDRPPVGWGRAWEALGTAAAMLMILAVILVMSEPWLDTLDPQWVSCRVVSARSEKSSVSGGKLSSSRPYVYVRTRDCGNVSINQRIRGMGFDEMAEDITPGQTWEFKMGMVSRWQLENLDDYGSSALDYRRAE